MVSPVSANYLDDLDVNGRLQSMRAMTWAHAILRCTGYTASGASKLFTPVLPDGITQTNSKIMYAYLRGERLPTRGERGKHSYDLVDAVDRHPKAHAATKWLDHPLWTIFESEVSSSDLVNFLTKDQWPERFAGWLLGSQIPPVAVQTKAEKASLKLERFDDFVFTCASHRLGHLENYKPVGSNFTEYLIPQAALLEPDFGYVQKPFLKMIKDFYIRTVFHKRQH